MRIACQLPEATDDFLECVIIPDGRLNMEDVIQLVAQALGAESGGQLFQYWGDTKVRIRQASHLNDADKCVYEPPPPPPPPPVVDAELVYTLNGAATVMSSPGAAVETPIELLDDSDSETDSPAAPTAATIPHRREQPAMQSTTQNKNGGKRLGRKESKPISRVSSVSRSSKKISALISHPTPGVSPVAAAMPRSSKGNENANKRQAQETQKRNIDTEASPQNAKRPCISIITPCDQVTTKESSSNAADTVSLSKLPPDHHVSPLLTSNRDDVYFVKFKDTEYPVLLDKKKQKGKHPSPMVKIKWIYYCNGTVKRSQLLPFTMERLVYFENCRHLAQQKRKKQGRRKATAPKKKGPTPRQLEIMKAQKLHEEKYSKPFVSIDGLMELYNNLKRGKGDGVSKLKEAMLVKQKSRLVYFSRGDDTAAQIAQEVGVPVEKILYDNRTSYPGITKTKKLKQMTAIVLPRVWDNVDVYEEHCKGEEQKRIIFWKKEREI